MDKKWLQLFLSHPDLHPNRTDHGSHAAGPPDFGGINEDISIPADEDDLGLGWIYYSLVRLYRPKCVVCVGSGRGFVPIIMAKGLVDQDLGVIEFIDPSLDDDFWKDAERTERWFTLFGVQNVVKHHLLTTDAFAKTERYNALEQIDMLFIDGRHFYEFVKLDFEAFLPKLSSRGLVLFHDSISRSRNPAWSGPRKFIFELEQKGLFQTFDLPFGAGLTLLQRRNYVTTKSYLDQLTMNWKGGPLDFSAPEANETQLIEKEEANDK